MAGADGRKSRSPEARRPPPAQGREWFATAGPASEGDAQDDATQARAPGAFCTRRDMGPAGPWRRGSPPVVLDEQVIQLPRAPAPQDPTASATVVEADRFAGELKGVAELAATAPGVAIRSYGGLGQLSTISIRGSNAGGVRVLLDGIPLDTAAGGGVDLSTIPLHWVDRVEVVRGAEGAYFGAGALGGAVNVVTLPAVAGKWGAEVTGGSFGTVSGVADVGRGRRGLGAPRRAHRRGHPGELPLPHPVLAVGAGQPARAPDPGERRRGPGRTPREGALGAGPGPARRRGAALLGLAAASRGAGQPDPRRLAARGPRLGRAALVAPALLGAHPRGRRGGALRDARRVRRAPRRAAAPPTSATSPAAARPG